MLTFSVDSRLDTTTDAQTRALDQPLELEIIFFGEI